MNTRAFGTIVAVLLALCPTHASSDQPDTSWVRWRMFLGAKVADGNGATDESASIAVDATGNVYVVGSTEPQGHEWKLNLDLAPLVPLPDGRDAFVAKLSTAGQIIWYTFLGGGAIERAHGVAVDGGTETSTSRATARATGTSRKTR